MDCKSDPEVTSTIVINLFLFSRDLKFITRKSTDDFQGNHFLSMILFFWNMLIVRDRNYHLLQAYNLLNIVCERDK